MSSPFDVEPPRWLQQATQSNYDESGAGVGLAGLANAISGGKSLGEGIGEARMNIQDPQWKLKAEGMKANIMGQVTQNEMQYAQLKERNNELSAWQQDVPQISSWLAATPDQRSTMPTPTVTSKQGVSTVQRIQTQDENYRIKKTAVDNQTTLSKLTVARNNQFLKDLSSVENPAEQAAIQKMVDQGGQPTPEAFEALALAKKKAPVAVQVATLRSDERKNIVQTQIDARKALQEQHHLNDMELQKLRNLPRVTSSGKPLTEAQYVNRHLNEVITMVDANWSKEHGKEPKTNKSILLEAQKMLSDSFRAMGESAPDPSLLDVEGFQDPNKATGKEGQPLDGQSSTPFPLKTSPDAPAAPSDGWKDVGDYKVRVKP